MEVGEIDETAGMMLSGGSGACMDCRPADTEKGPPTPVEVATLSAMHWDGERDGREAVCDVCITSYKMVHSRCVNCEQYTRSRN